VRRVICVTIATTALRSWASVRRSSSNLRDTLVAAAPPGAYVRIAGFVDLPMQVGVAHAVAPDRPQPLVLSWSAALWAHGGVKPSRSSSPASRFTACQNQGRQISET
jgi:hypothetical protein